MGPKKLREESKRTKHNIDDIDEAVEDNDIIDDEDSNQSEESGEDLMENMEE